MLHSCKKDFSVISKSKKINDALFTRKATPGKAIARQTFHEQLNNILSKASNIFGKHIRTHSFRATYITDLLSSAVFIEEVNDVIKHLNIKSTLTYKRSRLTQGNILSYRSWGVQQVLPPLKKLFFKLKEIVFSV